MMTLIPNVRAGLVLAVVSITLFCSPMTIAQSLLIDADHPFRILVVGEPGDASAFPVELFQTELERRLNKPLNIDFISGAIARQLQSKLYNAEYPEDTVVVLADLDWLAGQILYGFELEIEQLILIAQVSGPLSLALVVTQSSAIDSWQDLVKFSRTNEVRLAEAGELYLAELMVDLVEWQLGKSVNQVTEKTSGINLMKELRSGDIHAVFAHAHTLKRFNRAALDHVVPLMTFGIGRSDDYPHVPTFGEILGRSARLRDHLGLIDAISVFAPPKMPTARAEELSRIFQDIASDSLIRKLASRVDFPIRGGSPALVQQTVKRNRAVLERLKPLLLEH